MKHHKSGPLVHYGHLYVFIVHNSGSRVFTDWFLHFILTVMLKIREKNYVKETACKKNSANKKYTDNDALFVKSQDHRDR